MGSGSTIAAAEAIGYDATGLELDAQYFRLAEKSIPRLTALPSPSPLWGEGRGEVLPAIQRQGN